MIRETPPAPQTPVAAPTPAAPDFGALRLHALSVLSRINVATEQYEQGERLAALEALRMAERVADGLGRRLLETRAALSGRSPLELV